MSQRSITTRRLASFVPLVAATVALAACGANSDDGAADTTTQVAESPTTSATTSTTATTTTEPASTDTAAAMTDHSMADDSMTDHSMTDHSMTDDSMTDHSMADDSMADDSMDHSADEAAMAAMVWPRPWDPSQPIDFSGVPGVSAEQQTFAEDLVARTLVDLPQFADTATLNDLGFFSIGDEATGFEHYINGAYLDDEYFLDPNHPESVVYKVDGDQRTLVSAMFMTTDMAVDDPELEAIGGPLMQWHVHNDLCWELTPDGVKVAGTHEIGAPCPDGQVAFGQGFPMVHVWITPHECGPFAALEGIGAGQVDPDAEVRMDQCHGDH